MARIGKSHEYDGKREGEIIYRELSYQIMQAVFEVHNTLGPGFLETIYEEALAQELIIRLIPFERQKEVIVNYKGRAIGLHRLDLIIDDKILLELKAVSTLMDVFKQQTLSYLKATGLKLGILINFGSSRVEYIRIVN
jgi:GxxExxY protein